MAASTAYAQVFSRLGLLGGTNDGKDTNKIVSVATTSGSSWFSAQFFFSSQYYDTIVNGTPESLGEFTKQWFEAYGMFYIVYLLFWCAHNVLSSSPSTLLQHLLKRISQCHVKILDRQLWRNCALIYQPIIL